MDRQGYKAKIQNLKVAVLEYLGANGRYYGQLTRLEQSVEDLAQALNTRLDQLMLNLENGTEQEAGDATPRQRLADRFMETANRLTKGGSVDESTADQFERTLDMFDVAADLKRQSQSAKDQAETAAIRAKRRGA